MSQDILRLQKALKQDGYDPGPLDGVMGAKTSKVLEDYKAAVALMPRGIDVSRWQPQIDWKVVKEDGVVFAFIKATDGLGTDPMFYKHREAAKAAGLLVGAYHFFRPNRDLVAQADYILKVVGKLGKGDLPLVIDVERDDSGKDGVVGTADDIKATDAMMETFAKLVSDRLGKQCVIYSYGPYFYSHAIDVPTCPLFIADYRMGPPTIYGSWRHYTYHQYNGDHGIQKGVIGACDLDLFRGTLEDLQKLAA